MTAARRQLFRIHERIELPIMVLRTQNSIRVDHLIIDGFPFVRWPNGKPCEAVNVYLLESAAGITGDTLRTYAAELSPLIRYCSRSQLAFEQLNDGHFFTLSGELQAERSVNHPTERARTNNTVRRILSRVIAFLRWYQSRLMFPTQTPLIGEIQTAPQIVVRRCHNRHAGPHDAYYFEHRSMPTSNSREPKHPMPQSMIEDVERMIETLSDLDTVNERARRRYARDPARLTAKLEYVRARRRCLIWLMKRTGLRPAELIEMPLQKNASIMKTRRLIIPTKKRRKKAAPLRSFPIETKDAVKFQLYLTARARYVRQLRLANPSYQDPGAMLLGVDGQAVRKASVEKDFERLFKACGYTDAQACLSMFRHRFVTLEVVVHLREFLAGSGKTRQLMTDSDYRSILRRIATKTGHGSPESLWHYIDLAFKEMNVWATVDRQLERVHAADRFYEELLDLRHSMIADPSRPADQTIETVSKRLSEIVGDAKERIR